MESISFIMMALPSLLGMSAEGKTPLWRWLWAVHLARGRPSQCHIGRDIDSMTLAACLRMTQFGGQGLTRVQHQQTPSLGHLTYEQWSPEQLMLGWATSRQLGIEGEHSPRTSLKETKMGKRQGWGPASLV